MVAFEQQVYNDDESHANELRLVLLAVKQTIWISWLFIQVSLWLPANRPDSQSVSQLVGWLVGRSVSLYCREFPFRFPHHRFRGCQHKAQAKKYEEKPAVSRQINDSATCFAFQFSPPFLVCIAAVPLNNKKLRGGRRTLRAAGEVLMAIGAPELLWL